MYVFKEIDAKQLSRAEVKKIALEIKVLSSMNHEFIVRYHDYCKHDGNIYIWGTGSIGDENFDNDELLTINGPGAILNKETLVLHNMPKNQIQRNH